MLRLVLPAAPPAPTSEGAVVKVTLAVAAPGVPPKEGLLARKKTALRPTRWRLENWTEVPALPVAPAFTVTELPPATSSGPIVSDVAALAAPFKRKWLP